jgi:DNA-binding transcriptional MerR regulator
MGNNLTMTTAEVAERLGVSRPMVHYLKDAGDLAFAFGEYPGTPGRRKNLFSTAQVEELRAKRAKTKAAVAAEKLRKLKLVLSDAAANLKRLERDVRNG